MFVSVLNRSYENPLLQKLRAHNKEMVMGFAIIISLSKKITLFHDCKYKDDGKVKRRC